MNHRQEGGVCRSNYIRNVYIIPHPIFTVPLINKSRKTERWASLGEDGKPDFLHEPEFHGNPIDPEGSPVTMHWGYDIAEYIMSVSGLPTTIIMIDDLNAGIRAEYIDVLVSKAP